MFHLAWFVGKGFGLQSWRGTWSSEGVAELLRPDADIDLARALERAGFDYIMFEDSLQIADHFQGSMEQYLRHGIECPRGDPTALVSIVAGDQTHLPHSHHVHLVQTALHGGAYARHSRPSTDSFYPWRWIGERSQPLPTASCRRSGSVVSCATHTSTCTLRITCSPFAGRKGRILLF